LHGIALLCIELHCIAALLILCCIVSETGHTYPALFRMEVEDWSTSGELS